MATPSIPTLHNTNQTAPSSNEEVAVDVIDSSPRLSPASDSEPYDIPRCLQTADELKTEGNEHFRGQRWNEALAQYRSALGQLSRRKEKRRPDPPPLDELNSGSDKGKEKAKDEELEDVDPTSAECAKARAILNANIGACFVKLDDHKSAVTACTEALADDPNYVKALQRRASSNEKLNTWSSLTSAQEDYTKLLELLPSSQKSEVNRSLSQLKPRVAAAQKQETDEMIDKLKGVGNSILGNFGLSTDNFKFEPNGQGGYSMNFVR
ncbi:hypothetical protein QCA50_002049 [Cerrena zonata]|uniref:TPR-like protein n=1 Tax=Cerrena zonata TaxID=2478898 RepID=A0AAW0GYE3_9APHY